MMSPGRNTLKNTFCRRLREVRQKAGFSQKRLGMAAGIDEFVASTRINRYEQGIHEADMETAARLARVLNTPLSYFYEEDDVLASIILAVSRMPLKNRKKISRRFRLGMMDSPHDDENHEEETDE